MFFLPLPIFLSKDLELSAFFVYFCTIKCITFNFNAYE